MATATGSVTQTPARARRVRMLSFVAVLIAVIVVLIVAKVTWNGFLYSIGVHNYGSSSSQWYNFWSGFGSDLGEASILTGLVVIFRHHNCQVHGCWRLGTHPVEGTPYHACHIHHPGVPSSRSEITADLIADAWRACHPDVDR